MTFSSSRLPWLVAIGIVALAAGTLAACSPEPEPTPTPTAAFASEEEAFAAAEEVYRAYLEAGDNGEDVKIFLTGTALESQIESEDDENTSETSFKGSTEIRSVNLVSADTDSPAGAIEIDVCIDVSGIRVINASGSDVTPADREEVWRMTVALVGTSTELLIARESATVDPSC